MDIDIDLDFCESCGQYRVCRETVGGVLCLECGGPEDPLPGDLDNDPYGMLEDGDPGEP